MQYLFYWPRRLLPEKMSPVFLFEVILAHSGVFQGSVISSLLSQSEESREGWMGLELLCVPDETQIAVYDLRVTPA